MEIRVEFYNRTQLEAMILLEKEIRELFEQRQGILQLTPTWVPRSFNEPGRRLRLHPDDYYALGMDRGGICERWLGSVTRALNGPKTGPTEGMSEVLLDKKTNKTVLFAKVVEILKEELIGEELQNKYGTWPTFAKLFDYDKPLFHHLHLTEEKAQKIGMHGKPEGYYFPHQYNAYLGRFPLTYFGFDPSTDPEDIKNCIRNYAKFDTQITKYSRAYRTELGTGWYTPPGVIHAPASVLTYEPQWNSDVNTIMENVTMGEINPPNLLTDCTPDNEKDDIEALFSQIDWEESTLPNYKEKYFRVQKKLDTTQEGLTEHWVVYANDWIAAKKVTISPKAAVKLVDQAAYCALIIQGHGKFGGYQCETPTLLRFGQPSGDEFFVADKAAKEGVTIKNDSHYEPLVILQNFANNNPKVPSSV